MHSKRNVVIFDFGGVLVDWNPRYLYSKLFGESLENGHGVMGLAALVVAVEENCYWGVI